MRSPHPWQCSAEFIRAESLAEAQEGQGQESPAKGRHDSSAPRPMWGVMDWALGRADPNHAGPEDPESPMAGDPERGAFGVVETVISIQAHQQLAREAVWLAHTGKEAVPMRLVWVKGSWLMDLKRSAGGNASAVLNPAWSRTAVVQAEPRFSFSLQGTSATSCSGTLR